MDWTSWTAWWNIPNPYTLAIVMVMTSSATLAAAEARTLKLERPRFFLWTGLVLLAGFVGRTAAQLLAI